MIKILKSKNKQWYFVVKAKNGRILATSETYKTEAAAYKGAKALRASVCYRNDVLHLEDLRQKLRKLK